MTFEDYLKDMIGKSFLEGFGTVEISTTKIMLAMLFAGVISVYIFFCYRFVIRRTFYSKNFNISLVAIALITAGIIITIQSSLVVSLGMVGALSIVRFRTAVKEPMDLVFLFWSIGVGIMCGAGMVEAAVIMSLSITVSVVVLDRLPLDRASMILVINADMDKSEADEKIMQIVKSYCRNFKEKSRSYTGQSLDLLIELRVKDGKGLCSELRSIKGINSVSLLSHDGEVTF